MTNLEIARVMNEWMRRFIEEPDRFSREFEEVNQFIKDKQESKEPSYGETCAIYMDKIHKELTENVSQK